MKYFDHKNVKSYEEAAQLLKDSGGKAQALSGGTDLLGVCKDHILEEYPDTVVNLKAIPGYDRIDERDGALVLGAGARLSKVAELKGCPALAEAAYSVASPLIRNIATIGGNICQDVRCWYYRYPDSIGGAFTCKRKGGDTCYAIQGENRYHSVFGGMSIHGSACMESCPAGTDIPSYMEEIRSGNWDAAAQIIMSFNPIPMLTSRICPHPCQDTCNQYRCGYGDSVNIHGVERSLGDHILANADRFYPAPDGETGKKAAIIGAGPGGLAAAYYLRKEGHAVTVYDKMEKAGGVLQYGIPHYRLPKGYVDAAVKAIENMGVEFRLGVAIGKDITMEQIDAEYDSVYLGTGAWKQPILGIDGEKLTQFGLNFLVEVNTYLEKAIGNNVLVCGGGNVAMDVALTAVRLGAKSVKLICLEKSDEMPASGEEVARAKEEGVQILNGWGLSRIVTDASGKVSGLEVKKCVSVFDQGHRFAPVYDESEKAVIDSDYIIFATGQRVDLDFLGEKIAARIKSPRGLIDADLESYKTKTIGLYAGGDAVTGPDIAIRAVAAGRVSAMGMSEDMGVSIGSKAEPAHFTRFDREAIAGREAHKLGEVPVGQRTLIKEDAFSFPVEVAVQEAGRCMHCGCYAVNPSDIAPVLLMLDAKVVTTQRTLSAEDFFTTTLCVGDLLQPGEMVKEIHVPKAEGIAHYDKARVRDAIDFAIISIASRFVVEEGVIKDVRLVFGGVAPLPHRMKAVEDYLRDKGIGQETATAAADLAVSGACVMDKNEYKLAFMKSTLEQAILRAAK